MAEVSQSSHIVSQTAVHQILKGYFFGFFLFLDSGEALRTLTVSHQLDLCVDMFSVK